MEGQGRLILIIIIITVLLLMVPDATAALAGSYSNRSRSCRRECGELQKQFLLLPLCSLLPARSISQPRLAQPTYGWRRKKKTTKWEGPPSNTLGWPGIEITRARTDPTGITRADTPGLPPVDLQRSVRQDLQAGTLLKAYDAALLLANLSDLLHTRRLEIKRTVVVVVVRPAPCLWKCTRSVQVRRI